LAKASGGGKGITAGKCQRSIYADLDIDGEPEGRP